LKQGVEGDRAGAGAVGQRRGDRRGHWGAPAVLLGDPAGLGTQVAAVAEVLPLPNRLSSLDLAPAVEMTLASSEGLSAATIPRLTSQGTWRASPPALPRQPLEADRTGQSTTLTSRPTHFRLLSACDRHARLLTDSRWATRIDAPQWVIASPSRRLVGGAGLPSVSGRPLAGAACSFLSRLRR
jgi:hypothetical protein